MSSFTRKIKPFFKSIFQNIVLIFNYSSSSSSLILEIPNYFVHNWLWWRPSAHTLSLTKLRRIHYKSHFGPKIDVSITVIYKSSTRRRTHCGMKDKSSMFVSPELKNLIFLCSFNCWIAPSEFHVPLQYFWPTVGQ